MKKSIIGFLCSWFLACFCAVAQSDEKEARFSKTEFKELQIGYFKTTSIVFPYPIKSIDRGSQQILAQRAKGVENILLVKAGVENFEQTNLTVITSDGKLHGFVLNYDKLCADLNWVVDNPGQLKPEILFSQDNDNQKKIQQYADLALHKKRKRVNVKSSKFEIELRLTSVFIHQDILYFKLLLGNRSKIKYDIDQIRFYIADQKKSQRTASQEIEILPLWTTGAQTTIFDTSEVALVYALPKFTMGERKCLIIELIEKKGLRQVQLSVTDKDLMNLEILNTL